mgnify:CR=1 FL=1
MKNKIQNLENLQTLSAKLRAKGKKVVHCHGVFDLLHVGHLALLEYCATLGDTVAVGVASDEVVKLYKPNIPVIPLEQRIGDASGIKLCGYCNSVS